MAKGVAKDGRPAPTCPICRAAMQERLLWQEDGSQVVAFECGCYNVWMKPDLWEQGFYGARDLERVAVYGGG